MVRLVFCWAEFVALLRCRQRVWLAVGSHVSNTLVNVEQSSMVVLCWCLERDVKEISCL